MADKDKIRQGQIGEGEIIIITDDGVADAVLEMIQGLATGATTIEEIDSEAKETEEELKKRRAIVVEFSDSGVKIEKYER